MRRFYTAISLLLLLALCGCSMRDLAGYPYVSQENGIPRSKLILAVPQEEWMMALGGQLSEIVSTHSEGAVDLQVTAVEDPMQLYQSGKADMAFCSGEQIMGMDESLAYLSLPFLFQSPEDYLTAVNEEDSPVRTSEAIRQQTGGNILGVYYDCAWMLAASKQASNAANPLYGLRIGTDNRFPFREVFLRLQAGDTASGNPKRMWQLFLQGEISTLEFLAEEADESLGEAEKIYYTRHRIEGRFLLLREGAVEEAVRLCLLQAFSETVEQACRQRMEQEQTLVEGLCSEEAVKDADSGFAGLYEAAGSLYQREGQSYGLSQSQIAFFAF